MTAARLRATGTGPAAAAPISVAQEGPWYLSVFAPDDVSYNEAISFRYDGPLDVDSLRASLEEIVRRHEAWRTTFEISGGDPVQIVHPPPRFELPLIDLGELADQEAERRAVSIVAEMSSVPYDLSRGPLLRPCLIRYPGEHHRLYLAMHHLIFDGVSLAQIVLPELRALYEGFRSGQPVTLPEPPQYTDYANWEQAWITESRALRRLEHWRERLGDAPPPPSLPADRPRPEEPQRHGAALRLAIAREQVERLRRFGRESGATLFQVLAGVWSVLLSRYSGDSGAAEVVFATPADLRQRSSIQGVVGYCLSPLVLRVELGDDPPFAELVRRVRNEVLEALDNLVPFERIVRELRPAGHAGVNPIYNTLFVVEPEGRFHPGAGAWSLNQLEPEVCDAVGNAKLDLELQLDERPGGEMVGSLIYDRSLFDRSSAERIAGHWLALVDAVARDPQSPISRLPVLTEAERRTVLVEWNATRADRPQRRLRDLAHGAGELAASLPEPELDDQAIAAVAAAIATAVGLGPADTVMLVPSGEPPLYGPTLWAALAAGARVMRADGKTARDGAELSRLVRAEHVSLLCATAAAWRTFVDTGLRPARGLRAVSHGVLEPELAERLLDRCRVLWSVYGVAETSGCATIARVRRGAGPALGRPIANARAYVLDRHLQPVPVGVAGELVIAGAVVAAADSPPSGHFIADPFGDGLAFRTGERARWLGDGTLELVG